MTVLPTTHRPGLLRRAWDTNRPLAFAGIAMIAVLTVIIAMLMLHVVEEAINRAVETGGDIQIVDGVRVCMAAGLTFLIMRQVMGMSASLTGGYSMHTMGVVSTAVRTALRWGRLGAANTVAFGEGIFDGRAMSADMRARMPMGHRFGQASRERVLAGARHVGNIANRFRQNRITPG